MNNLEKRHVATEFRLHEEEGKLPMIVGHAAVWDKPSHELPNKEKGGTFREYIRRGAFTRSLSEGADVVALIDHDPNNGVLGRVKSGTLRLVEDEIGLRVEIDTPDTTAGRDLLVSMKRGDLDKMSFAFHKRRDEWRDGGKVRELIDVDIHDVSVVVHPAYEDTSVAVRSLEEWSQVQGTPRLDMAERRLRLADCDLHYLQSREVPISEVARIYNIPVERLQKIPDDNMHR